MVPIALQDRYILDRRYQPVYKLARRRAARDQGKQESDSEFEK
jgi:hypothetical protein